MMINHPYRYHAERIIRGFGIDFAVGMQEVEKIKSTEKSEFCVLLYDALSAITGKKLPWGTFTGVRPIKYIRENRELCNRFRISKERLALADEIIACQNLILLNNVEQPQGKPCTTRLGNERTDASGGLLSTSFNKEAEYCNVVMHESVRFHLYIGIPFCPSRCKYCSFVSESVGKSFKLVSEYVNLLIRELQMLSDYTANHGLVLDTIYIGGGTPTALPLENQAGIYEAVKSLFSLSNVREYTIEAGRPETITAEVLKMIKQAGATRISINPQSMNDCTLNTIRRGHTSQDVITAYEMSRQINPSMTVNMDLIAGLPGETQLDFTKSLNSVIEMNPDNITVHSLAYKRSAKLEKAKQEDLTEAAYEILKKHDYSPYYLYRLSGCDGDNIGYTRNIRKISKMSLYNVYMMDESSTVLAVGCGGATRLIRNDKIIKHYNYKFPYEYISRFEEMIINKLNIL